MSKLKIPEAAYVAGAKAYDDADPDSRWLDAIDAAAPLIVAAELRRLLNIIYTIDSAQCADRSGLDVAEQIIANRMDELDPEGLTK